MIKLLFVCTGNICRSPLAQVIFEKLVEDQHLSDHFFIDSAGTHAAKGHVPDRLAKQTAEEHGLKMGHILTKQITLQDFHNFDYVIAMDQENLVHLMSICPKSQQDKLSLLLSYAPEVTFLNVPDPYQEGEKGFDKVFKVITQGVQGLLNKIKQDKHL